MEKFTLADVIIILISSLGAIQSYFLALYVFSLKEKNHLHNLFVGALFLALAIRVSKSVLWAFWGETPLWIINTGFAAHATVGPLLLLYIIYYFQSEGRFNYLNLLHFIPASVIIVLSFMLPLEGFWYDGAYTFLLYHQLLYMVICLGMLLKVFDVKSMEMERHDVVWLRGLWMGVAVWGLAYFSNYVLGLTSYLLGPLLYSGIIYVLSYYGLKHQRLFQKSKKEKKYKNLNLSIEETERFKNKLFKIMEHDKPYLDPDFTITKLSEMIAVPSYILSHIINDELMQNFPAFVNNYRIKEAQERLKDPAWKHHKIASIAYECGFNSLSSFNTAFKKITNMTPSQLRNI